MTNRFFIMACCVICCLVLGFCYTYSIIQPYVMEYFNRNSSSASLPYTIFLAVFVLGNYVGGVMQRKNSVKVVLASGFLLMAIGIFTTSLLPTSMPNVMWFTYGGLLGLGDGMVYNVMLAMAQKWFPDRKGLATGIVLAVLGISATILSPLCNAWLEAHGFLGTFKILAAIYVAFGIFSMLTIKAPPEGYMADFVPAGVTAVSARLCVTAKDCFRTKGYYMLAVMNFCAVPAYVLLSAIFVSYGAGRSLSNELAIMGVSIASIMQVAGRFLVSTVSDKVGRKGAMIFCFAVTIAAVCLLTFSTGILYVVCFWLLSFTYGGTATTMPPLTTDHLGTENAGFVCSLVMIGFGIASIGTSFVAKAVDVSTTFILAGAVAIVGIVVTLLLPKPGKQA